MTPTERAFKHGVLKAQFGRLHPRVDNPYRTPQLKREFQRGVEAVRICALRPKPVEYTMPPRREPNT